MRLRGSRNTLSRNKKHFSDVIRPDDLQCQRTLELQRPSLSLGIDALIEASGHQADRRIGQNDQLKCPLHTGTGHQSNLLMGPLSKCQCPKQSGRHLCSQCINNFDLRPETRTNESNEKGFLSSATTSRIEHVNSCMA